ncbi:MULTISPECIES: hypothetical protein [Campylobacter]|uniref:hypothetical protein n=1 Tax=Campylobacter TaxID=194 RepID=UPI0023F19447|nr:MULTISPECIES: hypothetical protein [Campylobacter]MCI6641900.1 hypothetical protein [Campylobacter sp.]MDD7422022.1 hypothetical protein [Campylobacter hominis]MDY3116596.1 hypothetical protein [Campylobacter hominis]
MKDPDITPVRGYEKDITEAVISISLKDYGEKIIEVKSSCRKRSFKKYQYHFVEVMNCPGEYVNSGGQPTGSMVTSWLHPLLPLPLKA